MLKIQKAKLIEGVLPECTYARDTSKRKFEGTEIGKENAHPDLIKAFHALTVHWALLADQISFKDITDINNVNAELLEPFKCYGFSIGKNEKKPGISLKGQRKNTTTGKVMSWPAPYTLIGEAEETRYPYMDKLLADLDVLDKELVLYFEGDKFAPSNQTALEFPDDEPVTHAKIADEEKELFKGKIPPADPDAMARVAAGDGENGADLDESAEVGDGVPEGKKRGRKKRVPQSADHPGGIAE